MYAQGESTYDELPYEDLAFFHTHPSNLAVVATLCGFEPPPIETCSVLELGCGAGFNLLAMSESLPHARLVGLDLSRRQIEAGRALAVRVGAANVDLRVGDVAALDDALGNFDYVIAHGLLSWVPPAVRGAIFGACRSCLNPDGVAYLSYNTYPGWHLRGILRDALQFHASRDATALERVRQARVALARMLDDLPDQNSDHARFLRQEVGALRDDSDAYVFHEFLEADNHPLRFEDFAAEAAAHGLRYFGEARYATSVAAQGGDIRRALEEVSEDPMRQEQYHDLLRNRYFRQSLLCHAGLQPDTRFDPSQLDRLVVISKVERMSSPGEGPPAYRLHGDTVVRIVGPLFGAILDSLASCWPRPVPVTELIDVAAGRIERDGLAPGMPARVLIPGLLREGYVSGYWQLYAHLPPADLVPGERPYALALARACAAADAGVTNLLHRPVELNDAQRAVLVRLDGRTSVELIGRDVSMTNESVIETVRELAESWLLSVRPAR